MIKQPSSEHQSVEDVHIDNDKGIVSFKRNYFFEVKNPDQPKSAQALTAEEAIWHNEWKGQVTIVRTVEEALQAIK